MTTQKPELNVRTIRKVYPDCPQREIALGLMREGKLAQAEAWLMTLDQLIRRGQASPTDHDEALDEVRDATTGQRSA